MSKACSPNGTLFLLKLLRDQLGFLADSTAKNLYFFILQTKYAQVKYFTTPNIFQYYLKVFGN